MRLSNYIVVNTDYSSISYRCSSTLPRYHLHGVLFLKSRSFERFRSSGFSLQTAAVYASIKLAKDMQSVVCNIICNLSFDAAPAKLYLPHPPGRKPWARFSAEALVCSELEVSVGGCRQWQSAFMRNNVLTGRFDRK